jgi:hypothetical protein
MMDPMDDGSDGSDGSIDGGTETDVYYFLPLSNIENPTTTMVVRYRYLVQYSVVSISSL